MGITLLVHLILCLTKNHTIKAYWRKKLDLQVFLCTGLDGGDYLVSHPIALTVLTPNFFL